ncbi:uncharacterized protein LOC133836104 [Drosophila sulfurigaster albostrigata]|nr:uncharacterized protein LOC132785435 [Drosophila nasuta]XP_062122398.1 uncharacterized protein LOC133836104 [Drosophila sulfurigaster albostrigata]
MASLLLFRFILLCTRLSHFIKTKSPFVIEALMVTLCFSAIISKYMLLT